MGNMLFKLVVSVLLVFVMKKEYDNTKKEVSKFEKEYGFILKPNILKQLKVTVILSSILTVVGLNIKIKGMQWINDLSFFPYFGGMLYWLLIQNAMSEYALRASSSSDDEDINK